ncbi:MAG: hypothetical protein N2508_15085 [Anaerolineae bacterium]|nr:hypothetical protein [Anaerolineae bacterium]
MDETKAEALLKEAISHCYDKEEELWALFSALVGRLPYPLQVTVEGEEASLVGLDEAASGLDVGIMARVDMGGATRLVPLERVQPTANSSESAEWLDAYRYWLSKR